MRSVGTAGQSRLLRAGDLLLEKSGGGDKQPVGAVVLVDESVPQPAVCSNFIARIEIRDGYASPFLAYLHNTLYSARVQVRSIKQSTGIQNLDAGSYLSEPVPIPPLDEQRAIGNFLDRETAKIDRLIEQKERLIELLEEKRTALITRAVTRGLDPDVEMKDSGAEWLGEIPAHWDVLPLKRVWDRSDYGLSTSLSGVGPIPVLTMGHIQDGSVLIPVEGSLDYDEVPPTLFLKSGDLLYNRTNSRTLVGKVGLYLGEDSQAVSFASYLVRLRLNERALPEFFNYLLNTPSMMAFAQSLALLSINQANLNPTKYGAIQVPLPPLDEQHAIVEHLGRECRAIEEVEKASSKAITLLREYRTALISAAVTGKIDVREHAA